MNRRQAILAALRDAGERGLSGEALAGALGVSRAAIAKHVSALRAAGYTVAAAPGAGYVLVSVPDLPLPEEVGPLLQSSLWGDLHGGGETGSTNDDAKALARGGAGEGTVVLASEQSSGRGRFARAWSSPPGGVYLSVVLRPQLSVAETAPLPLVLALGVARGLDSVGVQAGVKWPNDVVLPGGSDGTAGVTSAQPLKLAGLLVEVAAESNALEWAVAGIGVNVRRPDGETVPSAAYVEDLLGVARTPGLAHVAAAVLDGIAGAYLAFVAQGFGGLLADEYAARSVLGGRHVRVSGRDGDLVVEGVATGVDAYGRLIVEGPDDTQAVTAGDVTLRTDAGW